MTASSCHSLILMTLIPNDTIDVILAARMLEIEDEDHLMIKVIDFFQSVIEQCSHVREVVKPTDKKKVLVKVHPEGSLWCMHVKKNININFKFNDVTPDCRVALRNDIYKILPNKVDSLVSLMMVEKVADSTYEMVGVGGLDTQINEIKEVIEL